MHDGAHGGVVGGPQVPPQREWAGASTVVGVVAAWRNDPAGPADLVKVDEERHPLAGLGFSVGGKPRGGTAPPAGMIVKLRRSRHRLGLTCRRGKESASRCAKSRGNLSDVHGKEK